MIAIKGLEYHTFSQGCCTYSTVISAIKSIQLCPISGLLTVILIKVAARSPLSLDILQLVALGACYHLNCLAMFILALAYLLGILSLYKEFMFRIVIWGVATPYFACGKGNEAVEHLVIWSPSFYGV
jgi:hypothetical protein